MIRIVSTGGGCKVHEAYFVRMGSIHWEMKLRIGTQTMRWILGDSGGRRLLIEQRRIARLFGPFHSGIAGVYSFPSSEEDRSQ